MVFLSPLAKCAISKSVESSVQTGGETAPRADFLLPTIESRPKPRHKNEGNISEEFSTVKTFSSSFCSSSTSFVLPSQAQIVPS
jgi:hypothetical protein